MDRWIPISRDELEELVSAQLTECSTPGFEQWTIADAIQHLLAFPYDSIRRGSASSLR